MRDAVREYILYRYPKKFWPDILLCIDKEIAKIIKRKRPNVDIDGEYK